MGLAFRIMGLGVVERCRVQDFAWAVQYIFFGGPESDK